MGSKIVIRKLKPGDAKAAYALMKAVLPEFTRKGYPKESINWDLMVYKWNFPSHIQSKETVLLGAFEGKRAVGLILAFAEYGGLINIDWIIIDRNHRRDGLGKALLRQAESLSKKRKLHRMYCDTGVKNAEGIAFFRKMGYTNVATLKDWNFHEDRYVWAKML